MRLRRFTVAAALVVCGAGLMAGCPNEGGFDNGSGVTQGIADGTYNGTKRNTTRFWSGGQPYWNGDWSEPVSLPFAKGAIVQPTGDWVNYGDVDGLDLDDLQITRVVDEIYFLDVGGYELDYKLTATWGGMSFKGNEQVTYLANADGSVSVEDQIVLTTSEGDGWEIAIDGEGELTSGGGVKPGPVNPGNPLDNPLLDIKSGKIRR